MEFLASVWQESDGEFSLYDGESGFFMSHYADIEGIIERFKADSRMDGWTYRIVVNMNEDVSKEYIIIPAA